MQYVKIQCNKKDKAFLETNNINLLYIESLLSLVLNTLRPRRVSHYHPIKIKLIDDACSMYTFNNTLCIRRDIFKLKHHTCLRYFIEDVLHEFGHYIQYVIDDVPFADFASDIEDISKKYYWDNKTEKQARQYEKLMPGLLSVYNNLLKLLPTLKTLKNEKKKERKITKRNKRRKNSKVKRRY
jgi:hypothetical protein